MPNLRALKISRKDCTLFAELRRPYTPNLQIVFTQKKKKSLLKSLSHTKKYSTNYLTQKIPETKISNPKKSFDHPRHLKSGVHLAFVCFTLYLLCSPSWSMHVEGR